MSVNFKNVIATSLIIGLVFPYGAQALDVNLDTDVTAQLGTAAQGTAVIPGDDVDFPRVNIDAVAPVQTTWTATGITTTTPSITLTGNKEEGRWNIDVVRFSFQDDGTLKYDATPPLCPPDPSLNQYLNGTDYYSQNGLKNPWPLGLDGEWANRDYLVSFAKGSPILCRDQITLDGDRFVERKYTSGNCEDVYFEEDRIDCEREANGQNPRNTQTLSYMAGCLVSDDVTVTNHGLRQSYIMMDKVGNQATCTTPEPRIDKEEPLVGTIQVEHEGLELPLENLSTNVSNANRYRADDGPLNLHVSLRDAPENTDIGSGSSGLNWEPITANPAIGILETAIANEEAGLITLNNQAEVLRADIILNRSNILMDLANIQRRIIVNNLLHKLSGEINTQNNFFMQAIISLTPNLSTLDNTDMNETTLSNIQSTIERERLADMPERDKNEIRALSRDLINRRKDDYVTELPLLLNRAQVSEVGDSISLTSTVNEFEQYYNQWQIDKRQNYSNVINTWVADINAVNRSVENLNDEFNDILRAYESDDLEDLATVLQSISPSSNILSSLLNTETAASTHVIDQQNTITSLNDLNTRLTQAKSYLDAYNPDTDTYNSTAVNQLVAAYNTANNEVLSIRSEIRDDTTAGTLAHSLYRLSGSEDAQEIRQLMNIEQSAIRDLRANLVTNKDILDTKVEQLEAKEAAIVATENYILQLRNDLAVLVQAQQDAADSGSGLTLNQEKITHLQISRSDNNGTVSKDFFPPETDPVTGNTFIWDINSFVFDGESAPIFTKAGDYTIRIRAFDQAGNRTEAIGYLKVLPAELVVNVTSTCNNASGIPYADNVDSCTFTVPMQDRFGNNIRSDSPLSMTTRDQEINGSYNLVQSLGADFVNGFRFAGGSNVGNQHVRSWTANDQTTRTLRLRSLLPTLEVFEFERDPDYAIGYAVKDGVPVDFTLEYPNINKRGAIQTEPKVATITQAVRFKPWVNVKAKGAMGDFDNRGWNPPIGRSFPIYVDAATNSARALPSDFVINVTGFLNSSNSYEFNDVNLAKPGQNVTFSGVTTAYTESTGNAGKPAPLESTINAISALAAQQPSAALFIPQVRYQVGSRNITLPGLPAGSCPENDPTDCFYIPPTDPVPKTDINISSPATVEPGSLTFVIDLTQAQPQNMRVYLESEHITTQNGDFVMPSQNYVNFSAGTTQQSFSVAIPDDLEVENDEQMRLRVESVDKPEQVENDSPGIGTIIDNDNQLIVDEDISIVEGGRCIFNFELQQVVDEDVTINASLGAPGDTASGGTGTTNDYNNANVSETILAGTKSVNIAVQTNDDDIANEGTEHFTLVIDSVNGGNLSGLTTETVECEIEDNDIAPNIYLYGSEVNEGENGSFTIMVGEGGTSGRADNEAIVLNMATYDIDPASGFTPATRDVDYDHNSLFTVTIPAGEKSVEFLNSPELVTNTDDVQEDEEVFGIRVLSVRNGATVGSLADARANITIRDGYTRPSKPTITSITAEDGQESTPEDSVSFRVNLDSPNQSGGPISLNLRLSDGTATGGSDYDNANVSVTIPVGSTWGSSDPVTIYDDTEVETDETFYAEVVTSSVNPPGAFQAIGTAPNSSMSTIKDNDMARSDLIINESQATESIDGLNTLNGRMSFQVNLTHRLPSDAAPLTVQYTPSPITSAANPYFEADDYTATFTPGSRTASLEPIRLINNLDVDGDKQFTLEFTGVVSGDADLLNSGMTSSTTGTVLDDDSTGPPVAPSIILTGDSGTEGDRVEITVGLTSPALERTEVTLQPVNVTTQNADYSCSTTNLTVVFPVGATEPQTEMAYCDLLFDDENEDMETFELMVSNVNGQIAANGDNDTATINIFNYQVVGLKVVEPDVIPENIEGGVATIMVEVTDNGNPLKADQGLDETINFTISPEDITAIGGLSFSDNVTDYNNAFISGTLEGGGKGEGHTFIEIPVAINDDLRREVDNSSSTVPEMFYEYFNMAPLATGNNLNLLEEGVVTIEDNDLPGCADKPQVHIFDAQEPVEEGNELIFKVKLDRTLCAGSPAITLNFSTTDIGANAGQDYTDETFSITINGGERYANDLVVQTLDDLIDESTEDLAIRFDSVSPNDSIAFVERFTKRTDNSNLSLGRISPGNNAAIGYISDNDETPPPGTPSITIGDTAATEGEDLLYLVKLSETNPANDLEIELVATAGDNATSADFGSDDVRGGNVFTTVIIPRGGQVGILKGSTIQNALINTIDNAIPTSLIKKVNLAFSRFVNNSSNTWYTDNINPIAPAVGDILDDDLSPLPEVRITGGGAREGENVPFTISLESVDGAINTAPAGGLEFTVMANTIGGTDAASASDFVTGSKTVVLSEGSNVSFTVVTNPDDLVEDDEYFNVRITAVNNPAFLRNSVDITAGNVNATGTIQDVSDPVDCIPGINCVEEYYFPGAAIEGQLIADEVVCEDGACDSTEDESIVLGTSTVATDIREEITRNTYELIRGRIGANLNADGSGFGTSSPLNTSNQPIINRNDFVNNGNNVRRWDIYADNLPDGGVTYLDGRGNGYFRLGMHRDGTRATQTNPIQVSGRHTIIVRNGSLNIVGDMAYANPESSLGVIVINDQDDITTQQGRVNRRGQLTVFKDVKHIVGTYFTDGSLVSNIWLEAGAGGGRVVNALDSDPNNDWDIVNNNGRLGRQLILSGNILSKNTIGKADKAIPEGPWGDLDSYPENVRLPRAQMYDFNYIRRYVPTYDSPGVLDSAARNRCTIVPGDTECYPNVKSFIIRVDPRLRENPPPGFQADGIQSLR